MFDRNHQVLASGRHARCLNCVFLNIHPQVLSTGELKYPLTQGQFVYIFCKVSTPSFFQEMLPPIMPQRVFNKQRVEACQQFAGRRAWAGDELGVGAWRDRGVPTARVWPQCLPFTLLARPRRQRAMSYGQPRLQEDASPSAESGELV